MATTKREGYDMQIKLLTVGDSGVGKSSLLLRYANKSFSTTFITTIGIDFKIKTIELDGKRVKLQIWDTAGQERFRTITKSYFRGAQGILLVYDVSDRASFNSVETWVSDIDRNADKAVNKILIGNKCELEKERVVSASEGEALARKHRMPFFECSAKNDINVDAAFRELASLVVRREAREGGPRTAPTGDDRQVNMNLRKRAGKGGGCGCGKG